MNNTIPVPRDMVEEILGYGTEEEPRVLGGLTYAQACAMVNDPVVPLTLPQVGDLFRWAWSDAEAWFNTDDLVEGADPIAYVFDSRIEDADRLRNLLLWAADHVDPMYTTKPPKYFNAVPDGPDCIVLKSHGLRYATLERIAASKVLDIPARWVVRRFDWFLPQEGRDPSYIQATEESELLEVAGFLTRLNASIRRGNGEVIL